MQKDRSIHCLVLPDIPELYVLVEDAMKITHYLYNTFIVELGNKKSPLIQVG